MTCEKPPPIATTSRSTQRGGRGDGPPDREPGTPDRTDRDLVARRVRGRELLAGVAGEALLAGPGAPCAGRRRSPRGSRVRRTGTGRRSRRPRCGRCVRRCRSVRRPSGRRGSGRRPTPVETIMPITLSYALRAPIQCSASVMQSPSMRSVTGTSRHRARPPGRAAGSRARPSGSAARPRPRAASSDRPTRSPRRSARYVAAASPAT